MRLIVALALVSVAILAGGCSGLSEAMDSVTPATKAELAQYEQIQDQQIEALSTGNWPAVGGSTLAMVLLTLGMYRRGRSMARIEAEEVAGRVAAAPLRELATELKALNRPSS